MTPKETILQEFIDTCEKVDKLYNEYQVSNNEVSVCLLKRLCSNYSEACDNGNPRYFGCYKAND